MPRLLPASLARLPTHFNRLSSPLAVAFFSRRMSTQKPEILSTTELGSADAKWLSLNKLAWRDQDGKERAWECASRKTRSKGGVDAVAIFTVIASEGQPKRTVIIEQYRPPIGKVVVELPAGLIDEGEGPGEAALRELREETGYGGSSEGAGKTEVREISPVSVNDPGMTDANMQLVTVDCHLPPGTDNPPPKADLEEGEHIVQRVVAISELYDVLKSYSEKEGYTVDARLSHLAYGLSLTKSLGLSDAESQSSTATKHADSQPPTEAKQAAIMEEAVADEIREAEQEHPEAIEKGKGGIIIGEEQAVPTS